MRITCKPPARSEVPRAGPPGVLVEVAVGSSSTSGSGSRARVPGPGAPGRGRTLPRPVAQGLHRQVALSVEARRRFRSESERPPRVPPAVSSESDCRRFGQPRHVLLLVIEHRFARLTSSARSSASRAAARAPTPPPGRDRLPERFDVLRVRVGASGRRISRSRLSCSASILVRIPFSSRFRRSGRFGPAHRILLERGQDGVWPMRNRFLGPDRVHARRSRGISASSRSGIGADWTTRRMLAPLVLELAEAASDRRSRPRSGGPSRRGPSGSR